MGKKQLTTLIIVLAVVALAAYAIKASRNKDLRASTEGIGEKLLPDFPINSVAEVSIMGGEESLRLAREEGDVWVVAERDQYPANFAKLRDVLREIWELKIVQVQEVGPSQYGRLQLLAPGGEEQDPEKVGTAVRFKNAEGTEVASLILGKEYIQKSDTPSPFGGDGGIPAGRWVKSSANDKVVLVSETLESLSVKPPDWLNTEFFAVSNIKTIERISADKSEDWKLEKKKEDVDEWTLLLLRPDERLDPAKISSHKNALSSPRFDDVVAGSKKLEGEAARFIIETFEGFRYDVAVSEELEERKYHLTVSVDGKFPKKRKAEEGESEEDKKKKDEEFETERKRLVEKLKKEKALAGRVYVVPNWTVSPLLTKRSEIVQQPGSAAGEAGATKTGQSGAPAAKATAVTEPVGIDLSGDKPKIMPPEKSKPAPKPE